MQTAVSLLYVFFLAKDYNTAVSVWERNVDKFDTPLAANRLGVCYEHGQGVTQDYQQVGTILVFSLLRTA